MSYQHCLSNKKIILNKNIFFLVFFLFFYLYGVNFSFLPIYSSRVIVFIGLAYLLFLSVKQRDLKVPSDFLAVIFVYGLCLLWFFFRAALFDLKDLSSLSSLILLLFHSFFGGLFFAVLFSKMKLSFRQVVFLVQIVITIQAFFVVLYFISWDFRELTFAYIPEAGNIDHRKNLFRSRGLQHGSSATLSLIQSMGLLFTAYLVSTGRLRGMQIFYLLSSFGLIFLSIFLTGRTGLLMLPVVFTYLFFVFFKKRNINKNTIFFVFSLPVAVILLFILLRLGYQYILGGFSTEWGEDGFDRLVRWVVGEFFSSDGKVQARTMQILSSHWFLPETWSMFLFGDPTTWSLNRIPSDIGFVRILHSSGLIGMLLFYLLFFIVFLVLVIKTRCNDAKYMLVSLAAFLFILEAKEPFLINLRVNSFILLLFCYVVITSAGRKSVSYA